MTVGPIIKFEGNNMKIKIFLIIILGFILAEQINLYGQDEPVLISVSANNKTKTEVQQGWPLIVTAELMNRHIYEDSATTVTISDPGGAWTNAIQLEVKDEQGNPVTWDFQLAHAYSGPLTLDKETTAEMGWWLSPEATAVIPAGNYRLKAIIDSSAIDPQDYGQIIASVPVALTVIAPAEPVSDSEIAAKHLLFADYYLLTGEDANAMTETDLLLAKQPENMIGLTYKGELLRQNGQLTEASNTFSDALNVFSQKYPNAPEPPVQLLNDFYDVLEKIESQTSFEISVVTKTPLHPYYNQGNTEGYAVNGIEGGELWIWPDTTYTFKMKNIPAETPFYFSTSPDGNGDAPYTEGVTGQPASGNSEITLTAGVNTPDILYYQCMSKSDMGWRIHIIRESPETAISTPAGQHIPGEFKLSLAYPNPFNPETRFSLTLKRSQHIKITVFDLQGKEMLKLFDGELPAQTSREFIFRGRGLASGMYFIQVKGEYFTGVRRVMLVK